MGIVFNGAKIGYTHPSVQAARDTIGSVDIRSESVMRFRFLALDKNVNLVSSDSVARDLSLKKFTYEYELDGNRLALSGAILDGILEVEITTEQQRTQQKAPLEGTLYPANIIALYPVLNGLELGKKCVLNTVA